MNLEFTEARPRMLLTKTHFRKTEKQLPRTLHLSEKSSKYSGNEKIKRGKRHGFP